MSSQNNGVGFFGLLTLLFIGLKLTGKIIWSWLWVLAPLWIPVGIIFGWAILYFAICFVKIIIQNKWG